MTNQADTTKTEAILAEMREILRTAPPPTLRKVLKALRQMEAEEVKRAAIAITNQGQTPTTQPGGMTR